MLKNKQLNNVLHEIQLNNLQLRLKERKKNWKRGNRKEQEKRREMFKT
jgi:hypothetical protein